MDLRKSIARWALALGVPGIALLGAIATTTPALAAVTVCEASGSYCIGGTDTSGFTAETVNHPGRSFTWTHTSGCMFLTHSHGNLPCGPIKDNDGTCLSATPDEVFYSGCSDNGTVWARDVIDSTHVIYVNRYETQFNGLDENLAGACTHLNWAIEFLPPTSGWCEQWTN